MSSDARRARAMSGWSARGDASGLLQRRLKADRSGWSGKCWIAFDDIVTLHGRMGQRCCASRHGRIRRGGARIGHSFTKEPSHVRSANHCLRRDRPDGPADVSTPAGGRVSSGGVESLVGEVPATGRSGRQGRGDPAELCAEADVVLLCPADTAAVREVLFGKGRRRGRQGGQAAGRPFQHRTHRDRDMAAELEFRCGMRWVDAPVSGGTAGAEAGTLAIMAGGRAEMSSRCGRF